MGDIVGKLRQRPVIGLDTCVFICHFRAHPRCLPLTQALLEGFRRDADGPLSPP